MSSVPEMKIPATERLSVFVLKVCGAVAEIAAANASEAQGIIGGNHVLGGAWMVSPSLVVENHGWDSGTGWRERFSGAASRIISFTPAPPPVDPCAPMSVCRLHPEELKEDEAD